MTLQIGEYYDWAFPFCFSCFLFVSSVSIPPWLEHFKVDLVQGKVNLADTFFSYVITVKDFK